MSPEEIEAIERLARLLQARKTATDAPPRRSWHLAAVLGATLCVASVLLFARVGRTAIDLEVEATSVGFSIDSEQILLRDVTLDGLGASGLSRIRLPEQVSSALGGPGILEEPDLSVRLSAAEAGGRRGVVRIAEIRLPAQTAVDLQLTGPASSYRLTLHEPGVPIDVGVFGPVTVAIAGLGSAVIDFTIPQGLALDPVAGSVDLDLDFRNVERTAMAPQIPVSRLEFWRLDEFGDRRLSVVRTLSTVRSGTIHFEELDGASRTLRAGEILRLPTIEEGWLRTVRLLDEGVSLAFHGQVRGLSTGADARARSLMPTWLDWLRAQHGLSLLWGTTLYVAGVAAALLRWFKGGI